jgi:hypothetical protein
VVHPSYKSHDFSTNRYDLSLLFLPYNVPHYEKYLVTLNQDKTFPRASVPDLLVSGWGSVEDASQNYTRATINMDLPSTLVTDTSQHGCDWLLKGGPGMICAVGKRDVSGVCHGDSGSPLVAATAAGDPLPPARPLMVGVTSAGVSLFLFHFLQDLSFFSQLHFSYLQLLSCDYKAYPGQGSIYAPIADNFDWIKNTVCSRASADFCASPSSSPTTSTLGLFAPVGKGHCHSADYANEYKIVKALYPYLSYIVGSYANDLHVDASACTSFCAQNLIPELVGVETEPIKPSDFSKRVCSCLYDGAIPSPVPNFTGGVYLGHGDGFNIGTGPVQGYIPSNLHPDTYCHRLVGKGTVEPTTSTSPTLSPTHSIYQYVNLGNGICVDNHNRPYTSVYSDIGPFNK